VTSSYTPTLLGKTNAFRDLQHLRLISTLLLVMKEEPEEAAPEISGVSVGIGIMVPLGVLVVIFDLLGHMTELEKMRQSTR